MNTDTLMILLFPILDFLPFGIARYWLFKERLRIPFKHILLVLFGISFLNCVLFAIINSDGYESAARYTTLMRYGFLLLQMTISFVLIKDSFAKNMFTCLLMISYSFFVFGNANFIESRWFFEYSDHHPYLVYNIARFLILLITYPFFLHFLHHTVRKALSIEDKKIWRYMWKIPLFSTMFGMLYCTVTDVYAFASWQFLMSRYLMVFGSCYISFVLLRILEISQKQVQAEEALRYADISLNAQRKQYESLSSHMQESRRARHDFRQHLVVMEDLIDHDDKEGLRTYLREYRSQLPVDTSEVYCRNDVVNAIVSCYGDIARQNGISFEARIGYPEQCPVSNTDAAVLFGNLLENAVEACLRKKGGTKFIRLTVNQSGGGVVIVMDNSFSGTITREGDALLSSKNGGLGIGTSSIKGIAQKYNGYTEFSDRDGVFSSSVFLHDVRS